MNRFETYLPLLKKALIELDQWRSLSGPEPGRVPAADDPEEIGAVLSDYVDRLKGDFPFHHPSYAGHMIAPPHPAAWIAYTLAMSLNPNNHSVDSGRSTTEMEKEVTEALAGMVGFKEPFLGHLTSGGTVANLEALWVARELHPDKAIASTANAHYTHPRMCRVLKARHLTVPVDPAGHPDMAFLEAHAPEIGTLVVTMGTTGTGHVEPLHTLLPWAAGHGIRIHLDAAYGGFYKLLAGEKGIDPEPWRLMDQADSVVIDPHKHGLQPYGCGSVAFRDRSVSRFYEHDSPYTYFTAGGLHLGEITLECSRPGAAAGALWLTLRLLPLTRDGLGRLLVSCRNAALALADGIGRSERYWLYAEPDLDIVCYVPEASGRTTSAVSDLSRKIMDAGMNDPSHPLHVSLLKVPASHFTALHPGYEVDSEKVTILRSVLMKAGHEAYAEEILSRLEKLCDKVTHFPRNPGKQKE